MDQAILVALVMLVCVLTMLVLGIPISISIGLASTIAMLFVLPFENAMGTAAQKVFTGVNSFSLLAIPFFILAGNIMNNGGIAIRLVNCAKILSGRMPGALAETNVVANMLFGAISGSGVAAAAAIGGTIGPLEEKEGYSKDYMAAVNIASAPTGMLIPPSNTLIVYSTVAGSVSISALFMAGYLPGLLWGIGVMVIAGNHPGYCVENRMGGHTQPAFNRDCYWRYSNRCFYGHGRFRYRGCIFPAAEFYLPQH